MNLRPDLAQHLEQRFSAFAQGFRHNLALVGPPGSGKTYQVQRLLARPWPQLSVIYCPVYRESSRSFIQRFSASILQSALGSSAFHAPVKETLLQVQASLPRTAAALESVESLLSRRVFAEAFSRALDVIPLFTEERQKPCVLILDEFLHLEELGLGHAFHELGKRVMTWPSTLFVLASSSPYRARLILRERLQLLFGQFEMLSFETLDASQAQRWVCEELNAFADDDAVVPFLIQWLGAHPWYLSVVLKRLKESAALRRCGRLTEGLFREAVWDVLGNPDGPLYQWCASGVERLNHLRNGAHLLEVLVQAADGARTLTEIGRRAGKAGLSDILQFLVEQDLLQRRGACWYIHDPVLRSWLLGVMRLQRSGGFTSEEAAFGVFQSHLAALWRRWQRDSALGFSEQVVRVFGRFRDDILSLDGKTGKLPPFANIRAVAAEDGRAPYLVAEGEGKCWCVAVAEHGVDEQAVARFDAFCKEQTPRPSRKVVVTPTRLDDNARLLAKAVNMWVWEAEDWSVLRTLYGEPKEAAADNAVAR